MLPNSNAIISTSIRLDPDGNAVHLDDRRIELDPGDSRSAGFAQVLDGLAKLRRPAYVEFDPGTNAVTRVLVPAVGRVVRVDPTDDGLDIELDASHARHVLRTSDPGSAELERELRGALDEGRPVIVVEDDAHTIIGVQAFTPDPELPLPPFPGTPEPRLLWPIWLLRWIWWLICWPWWWWRCPSGARAQQIFDAMAATSCNPLTVPPPCIPFLYPDDGCWARAHEMCRLMLNMGLTPRKVWIDHSSGYWLHVNTRNNPNCFVEWGWHVAPTLCVRTGPWFFSTQRMVIDPALFTTPVTEATWKGVQGDPGATLTDTDWTQFWHGGGTDPGYTNTIAILAQYRLALQTRAIQVGPPPYANCP